MTDVPSKPAPHPSPGAHSQHRSRRPPATILVLLVLVAGAEGVLLLADYFGYENLRLVCFAILAFHSDNLSSASSLYEAQPWVMFISYVLLHIGPFHMLGNLLTLYLLWYLMPWMYVTDFLLVFAGGALCGALIFLWLAPPGSVMTGASGAVASLAAVWAVYEMFLVHKGHILSLRIKRTAVLTGLVVWGVLLSIDQQLGMAWQAHLGGALAGGSFGAGLILRAIWEGRYSSVDCRPPSA